VQARAIRITTIHHHPSAAARALAARIRARAAHARASSRLTRWGASSSRG